MLPTFTAMPLSRSTVVLALTALSSGCIREPNRAVATRREGSTAVVRDARATAVGGPTDAAPAIDAPVASTVGSLAPVIELVRRENWREARTQYNRLGAELRSTREGRYLGARIALALGDDAGALPLLQNLGAAIPALQSEIERLEAGALARTGRAAEARALYNRLHTRTRAERDRAMGAEQAQAMGDTAAAAQLMRTWAADPPQGIDRTRAWRNAARALEAAGDTAGAVRAWKRIAVDEPDSSAAAQAREALTRLNAPLATDEVLSRAQTLNARARYAEVITELSAMSGLRGAQETRRMHLLARALFYARNRYADAHVMLRDAAARADNPERDEDAFLSARALARSDRDDEAIPAYDAVARTVRGRWGDEAAFRAAWIVARQNRVEPAAQRLRAILRDRTDARPQLRNEAAWELGWLLYGARRFTEAAEALTQSAALAPNALEKGRGWYWSAVSKLRANDRAGGITALRAIIAEKPLTYYAFLAETRLRALGEPVAPPADPQPRREAPVVALPENVRWLRTLGFEREGGVLLAAQDAEIRARLPADRADEAVGLLYLELGETHRAYGLSQRHGDLLDHEPTAQTRWAWDCSYPRPYAHWVEAAEDANHLPRHYLYAIMRQESAFNSRDVSNARAMGLLQMIPPTTRRVAQEMGIEYREELLFEPEYNVRTAGHYIGRLFTQYRNILPRAIGAFNAGPGAMGRWVRQWPELELDEFVERIPFDETRTYVRRVMQNLGRYRYLHGPRDAAWPMVVPLSPGADAGVDPVVDY